MTTPTRTILLAALRSWCASAGRAIAVVDHALGRWPDATVYVRKQIVHDSHIIAELAAKGVPFPARCGGSRAPRNWTDRWWRP
ncbi:hypothetical protein [Amycolatopsis alba]|uniref:hypothetical protein n=1 Tax=Amycolatopsis alba TaxID=76020 RepID=UPI0011785B05